MKISTATYVLLIGAAIFCSACKHDLEKEPDVIPTPVATPYNLVIPQFFPPMDIPSGNPLTVEGIALGRHLFWEKKLSGNNMQSCGTCHIPANGFSDPDQFSTGINGQVGNRQAMALVNLGWAYNYFWDGRSPSLEDQVTHPVENPIEMAEDWDNALQELRDDPTYPPMFLAAFGTEEITKEKAAKAMASFLRTMISSESKFDRERRSEYEFTLLEETGFNLFLAEGGSNAPEGTHGGDCFHCHGQGGLQMGDYLMHNNGLDASFENDPGFAAISGNVLDSGKFKTVTLRNVELTAPYMHDGRFTTLEEVLDHYNTGGTISTTIDPFMEASGGGLFLDPVEKTAIIAFLKCLTDTSFLNDPKFSDPH